MATSSFPVLQVGISQLETNYADARLVDGMAGHGNVSVSLPCCPTEVSLWVYHFTDNFFQSAHNMLLPLFLYISAGEICKSPHYSARIILRFYCVNAYKNGNDK